MAGQIQLNLDPQSAELDDTARGQDSSKALSKDRGVGGSLIVGMILPLTSI